MEEFMDEEPREDDVDATNEAEIPKIKRSPVAPSRQERLEHYITHLPFRSCCPECVAGKCKANPHFATDTQHEDAAVPLVAFDYAFARTETGVSEDDRGKMLVGRDRASRCYCCIAVPQKGVDAEEYSVKRVLK